MGPACYYENTKTMGSDDLIHRMLVALLNLKPQSSYDLNETMIDILNFCLLENQITTRWKKAIVKLHYKGKDEKLEISSYMSISVIFLTA